MSKRRLLLASAFAAALWLRAPLDLSPYFSWLLALPLVGWCAAPFYQGAARGFRRQRANADMLVAVSLLAAFAYTTVVEFAPELLPAELRISLFGTIASLAVFPLFGRWCERLLTEGSGESIWRLMRRIPATARRISADGERVVACGEVKEGERLRIAPGESVPLDAEVLEGRSRVDESLWTGSEESAEMGPGSRIFGGTVNKDADLIVRVLKPRSEMELVRLIGLVAEGFSAKKPTEGLADRLCRAYVPIVVIAAVCAALLWSWRGGATRLPDALAAFAYTLAVACPWSLAWAAPVALAFGIRRAGRIRMRIRNSAVLQTLDHPDVLLVNNSDFLTESGVVLASADRDAAVQDAAARAGIERVDMEVREEDKIRIIRELQSTGKCVAMVGEGVRDAPGLSRADLGIALALRFPTGVGGVRPHFDLAAEAADLVLETRELSGLTRSIQLTVKIRAVIRENLMWSFVPTVLLLPVAAGAFRPGFSVVFQPEYAAAAALISGAAILVNSYRRLRV